MNEKQDLNTKNIASADAVVENTTVAGSAPSSTNSKNTDAKPIISARNLDFVYNKGKNNEFHALIDISFDIYPEEFIMIFGPSGCGKSTLLNVIAGLETPDSGSIIVFERDLTKMDAKDFAVYHRNEVGMVYQAYNLITSLTVLDNVALPQIFVNVSKGKREAWAKTLLERFDILKHANKIPTELSGGQQQRIGIARAIVNNPNIVLADEPVGNLDSVSAKMVMEILGELNVDEKKTVIMVTHNPENLDQADRILYMKDGVITREVINRDKRGKKIINKPKTPVNEINELMRTYQGMSPEQINILIMPYKAKIFVHHFSSNLNMEETRVFEDILQRRLLGSISEKEFFEVMDRPSSLGGVGFDKRTAENILERINKVIKIAYFVYQKARQRKDEKGEHLKISDEEKAEKVLKYLYETCYLDYYKKLSDEQGDRILKAVSQRLLNKVDKRGFYDLLDNPLKDGGAGLNAITAKSFSEELELILILGFGVVSVNSRMKALAKKEEEDRIATETIEKLKKKVAEEDNGIDSSSKVPNAGEILNQMQEQLGREVKRIDDDLNKHEEEKKKIFDKKEIAREDSDEKTK